MNLPYRGVGGARVREDDEGWAGMSNDIDFDADAPATVTTERVAAQRFVTPPATPSEFKEPCAKCKGTGRFNSFYGRALGSCFACKGAGFKTFKTSTEDRTKARAAVQNRKASATQALRAAFLAEHAEVHDWIQRTAHRFDFAGSMAVALDDHGTLTPGQLAACQRCMERDKVFEAEKAAAALVQQAKVDAAPAIQTERLFAAFEKAKASGLKWPKLHFDGYVISMAGPNSANAGALYVKSDNDVYLGKIFQGKFLNSRDCTAEVRAQVIELMADPEAASKAYGLRTGSCCICNRELTDPVSVANGIGPICANRFF
jgi:hypothetical protein